MKIKFLSLLLAAALLAMHTPLVLAQESFRQWSAVQAIGVDERLVVKQKDGKSIEGRMIEASETNLTISRDKKVVNISRDNIREVYHSTGKAAKGKWALIGAGIGAGVGGALGAIKYSPDSDDSEVYIPIGIMFGAGGGAVGGLLFGASKRQRTLIFQQ